MIGSVLARSNPESSRLVAEHLPMARRIALRVARGVPAWMDTDDLVAAAMIGLTEAAKRYDGTRGEPFVGFAEKRIRGAVLDELRRGDVMSRRARQAARRVQAVTGELQRQLGRPPEDEEAAEALKVSVEEYREELRALTHVAVVQIDPEQAGASSQASPEDVATENQIAARLRKGLAKLEARDAQILSLYYCDEMTYAEIGRVLGVSESRVCQLHGRAVARLKVAME